MNKLIIASNNENKVRELKEMLSKFPIEVMSLKEAGIKVDVEETADTFEGNAFLKAQEIHRLSPHCMVLSDDSGLMVDALDGAPGIYSARFSGEDKDPKANNAKLLRLLEGKSLDERSAKFVCAIVLLMPDSKKIVVRGEAKGQIAFEESGKDGFGYDPLFYVPEYNMTFAEMSADQKNKISHRAMALKKLENELKKIL